jgi:hypothetical protein
MSITPAAISRLKSQLLNSGLQSKNQALYQVINQLIDAVADNATTTQSITGGSGGGGGSGISGATVITEDNETATFPNSRELRAGAGINIQYTPNNVVVIHTALPFNMGGDEGEGVDGPPGPQGPPGSIGPVGPTGASALAFFYGYDGEDGVDGLPGITGPAGSIGQQGGVGPPGLPGIDGIDGEDGDTTFVQNSYLYPPLLVGVISGIVQETIQDAPVDGQSVALSLTKGLELRVQTDLELRGAIIMLIEQIKDLRIFLELIQGVK